MALLGLDPVRDAGSIAGVAFLHVANRDASLLLNSVNSRLVWKRRLSDGLLRALDIMMLIVVVDLRSLELLQ